MAAKKLNDPTIADEPAPAGDMLVPVVDSVTGEMKKTPKQNLLYFLDPDVGIVLAKQGGGYLQIRATGVADEPLEYINHADLTTI